MNDRRTSSQPSPIGAAFAQRPCDANAVSGGSALTSSARSPIDYQLDELSAAIEEAGVAVETLDQRTKPVQSGAIDATGAGVAGSAEPQRGYSDLASQLASMRVKVRGLASHARAVSDRLEL
jgi:hypothetical protein